MPRKRKKKKRVARRRRKRPARRRVQRKRRTKRRQARRPRRKSKKKKGRRRPAKRRPKKRRPARRKPTRRRRAKKGRRKHRKARRRPAKRRVRKKRRATRKKSRQRRRPTRRHFIRGWTKFSKDRLLDLPICDLNLQIDGSQIKPCIRRLNRELRLRGLVFRPHFWLSNEWYTPDGVPGIAIPFFLANARLRRLERELMLEVEGGTEEWCLKLMRHETAHALLNAYRLHQRRDWQKVFGRSSQKYPDTYLPQPYSKRFVIHLENWYAQAHPHEDWAETFAVWLKPNSDWRKRYKGWPALKKLEYVDQLMKEIRDKQPLVRNRRVVEPVSRMRQTLREYYADKQQRYAADSPEFFDRDLRRLFSDAPEHKTNEKAWHYVRRVRQDIIDIVGRWTSEYDYRINEVLKEMTERCKELDLRVGRDDHAMKDEMIACLTMLVMNKLHSGGFHISL